MEGGRASDSGRPGFGSLGVLDRLMTADYVPLFPNPTQQPHPGSLKLAEVGVFTPQEVAHSSNQAFFPLLHGVWFASIGLCWEATPQMLGWALGPSTSRLKALCDLGQLLCGLGQVTSARARPPPVKWAQLWLPPKTHERSHRTWSSCPCFSSCASPTPSPHLEISVTPNFQTHIP